MFRAFVVSQEDKSLFRKGRKWILLACLLVGIVLDVFYCRDVVSQYPEVVISGEELLYDENRSLISGFEISNNGAIRSENGDPWIAWELDEAIPVEEMNIVLTSMSESDTWGQLYLFPDYEWITYDLSQGENKIKFPTGWREKEVEGFRFDLTTEEDIVMNVDKIVINNHKLLVLELQVHVLVAFAAVIALFFVFWAWQDFVSAKGKEIYWIGGAIAVGLQIGCYCNLFAKFIKENKQGMILIWYLIMMAAVAAFQWVALRFYSGKTAARANELWANRKKKVRKETDIEVLEIVDDQETQEETVKEKLTGKQKLGNTLVIGLLFVFSAIMNFAIIEILGGIQFDFSKPLNILFNLVIFFGVALACYLITRRPGPALIVSHVLFVILALVNHYYFQFRGEPFEFASVIMADTAMSVLDNYQFLINDNLWFVILTEVLFLVVVAFVLCTGKTDLPKLVKHGLVIPVAAIVVLVYFNTAEINYWSIAGTSKTEGYMYSFFGYLKEMCAPKKPSGYSVEQVEEVLKQYEETDGTNTPDVIVIMNEAFTDLASIYDFETDGDTTPFIDSLTENTIKGNLLVSVFGGTTCNSEYEFLTGNSMAFFPSGSVPYMQFMQEEQQSVAQVLKNRGYKTTAYHAYYKSGFHRSSVYPLMGLDEFYGIENDLPGRDIFRVYLSDRSDYENVEYLYQQSAEADSQFIFNVTMQNHGGYAEEYSTIDITSQPAEESMRTSQLQEYMSLIHESDDAFRELVEYYQNVEKDTIILMFGDHQPGLGADSYNLMDERVLAEDATLEEKQKQYISSFVIWANYDIEEQEDVFLSANYLRAFLLNAAGMDLSCYDNFLLNLMEKYPAINALGYCDADMNWYPVDEMADQELVEYSWLTYHNVFDKKNLKRQYFME